MSGIVTCTPSHVALTFSAAEIYSFDRAGRLLATCNGRSHFWRSLSEMAVEKFSEPAKAKQAIPLSLGAADERRAHRAHH